MNSACLTVQGKVSLAALLLATTVSGCERHEPPEQNEREAAPSSKPANTEEHRDEPAHEGFPRRVKLSDRVVSDARIKVATSTKEVLSITSALPGEIAVDPDKSARVSSPIAGRLARVLFQEGSRVEKGTLLATVRVPDLGKLRASQAAAKAKGASARSNARRLEELSQKGLASNQELLDAQAGANAVEAEAHALEEQLHTLGLGTMTDSSELSLRAPIGGVVIARAAVVGQPIGPEDIIASIADLSEVWFLGRVFEKDLEEVHSGVPAEVQLNAFPNRRFQGMVEYVGQQIDPVARTVIARVRLANPDDALRIGLFGTAHVATGAQRAQPVLVVPRTAVSDISGKPVVFVRQPDGDFELHEVVLGESNLGRVQVLSGLREGESVVVEGAFTLKSAVLRSSLTEEE
jgi:cobalt-zinc-cadmium efflux system membrane fusion protein